MAESKEASTSLDLPDLRPFLRQISTLVDEGFGPDQINDTVQVAGSMEINDEVGAEFKVQFEGKSRVMEIVLHKDDFANVNIYFFAHPTLSNRIMKEISRFFEERGM
jgi:hypothetical protein